MESTFKSWEDLRSAVYKANTHGHIGLQVSAKLLRDLIGAKSLKHLVVGEIREKLKSLQLAYYGSFNDQGDTILLIAKSSAANHVIERIQSNYEYRISSLTREKKILEREKEKWEEERREFEIFKKIMGEAQQQMNNTKS